jgi:dTDP-4-amino-4,6-dideoxygalactose transaminase
LIGPEFGLHRDQVHKQLESQGIFSRRYFYPLVSDMPMYREQPSAHPLRLPHARALADMVLCLPLHAECGEDAKRVVAALRQLAGESA